MAGKKWTDDDLNFFKENYPIYGPKYCSEKLNRSLLSIKSKRDELKLVRDKYIKYNWPKSNSERRCSLCKNIFSVDNFSPNKHGRLGRSNLCKKCNKQKKCEYDSKNPIKSCLQHSLYKAKSRAKNKNIEFNITINDLEIPKFCPVLNIPILLNSGENSPTIDRINNNKGYIKGNIKIISSRANRIKNDGTIEEFESIIRYIKENTCS